MVPEKLSAIRRCPLFGVSAIRRVLKYGIYGKRSWYIAHCPLYGRCPLFGVSAKRGSTVQGTTVPCEVVIIYSVSDSQFYPSKMFHPAKLKTQRNVYVNITCIYARASEFAVCPHSHLFCLQELSDDSDDEPVPGLET